MGITVCLDSGHYGKYNRSTVVKSYYESDMAWKLHNLLEKYLKEYGIKVVKTRSSKNKDLALYSRGKKSKGCDVFLSLHSNACGTESVDHVAVYHLTDDKKVKCDDISKEIAKKLAPVIADVMGTKQGYKILTRKSGNDKNGDGVMNDNYYGVLHGARLVGTPGLILEHSFHTNTRMTKWLLEDDNLDKLARAEAKALAEYFKVKKETPVAKPETSDKASDKAFKPYKVKITTKTLNIRKGAGTKNKVVGVITDDEKLIKKNPKYYFPKTVYTIVEEKMNGLTKWGRLKSGAGWISLGYTKKV